MQDLATFLRGISTKCVRFEGWHLEHLCLPGLHGRGLDVQPCEAETLDQSGQNCTQSSTVQGPWLLESHILLNSQFYGAVAMGDLEGQAARARR